jgi:hypothetical protein
MTFFSRSSKVAPTTTSSKKTTIPRTETQSVKIKSEIHLPAVDNSRQSLANRNNSLPVSTVAAQDEDEILEANYNKYIKQIHSTDLVIFKSWFCVIDQHNPRPLENNTMKVSELIDRLVSYHLLSEDSFQTNEIELFLSQAKLQLDDVINFRQYIQSLFLTKIYEKKRRLTQTGAAHFLYQKSNSLAPTNSSPQEKKRKDFFRSYTTATGTEQSPHHGAAQPPKQPQQPSKFSLFPSLGMGIKQKSARFNFMKFSSFDRDEKGLFSRQGSIDEDGSGVGTSATLNTNNTNGVPTSVTPPPPAAAGPPPTVRRLLSSAPSFDEEKSFSRRLFKRLSSNILSNPDSVDDQDERSGRSGGGGGGGGRSIASYFRRRDNNVDGAVKKICKVTIHSMGE